ncbi:phage holin family protein [Paenibacillus sp. IITD108]|uniref:phage holin family protein n=1 Tax=Paenibacillus sp. IITD108 TaxID=3116649 RepID=UPI002F3E7282
MKEQTILGAIGAAVLPVYQFLFGTGDAVNGVMMALLFFIVMDWLSGIRAANKDKSYTSKYGIDGIFRTFFMLLLPAGGHLLDKAFGIPDIIFGAIAFGLLYHVIKSMTANAIRAEWGEWLPVGILEKVTSWVESEIEQKAKRSLERRIKPNEDH